jgi:hypothetical protein
MVPAANMRDRADRARTSSPHLHAYFMATSPTSTVTPCSCSRQDFMDPVANTRGRAGRARISSPHLHACFAAASPTSTALSSSTTPPAPVAGKISWIQRLILGIELVAPGSAPPACTLVSRPQSPRQPLSCLLPHPLLL